MSFKKTKISSKDSASPSKLSNIKKAYELSKKRSVISSILLSILAIGMLSFFAMMSLDKLSNFQFNFDFLANLNPLKLTSINQQPEKINFLLAGVGGGAHDGPQLTDTIILVSLNTRLKTASLLSIPRDLYVEYPGGSEGRINELYMRGIKVYGKEKGIKYLEQKVTEITGENIDHFLVVDFDGFRKFIDLLGGLTVDVPEDLVDTQFPKDSVDSGNTIAADWAYETFSIKKGLQVLNGDTALKYARSRHSTSDFDRSLRQQLIMKAVKDKLLELNYITNPGKIQALFSTISEHIQTDLSFQDIFGLAMIAKDIKNDHILSFNLNDSCFQSVSLCDRGGLLYTPQRILFGGAAVLLPDGATNTNVSFYGNIQRFANIVINYPEMFLEKYTIHLVNATKVGGLANKYALYLKKYGFNVPDEKSVWSTKDSYPQTTVFYRYDPTTNIGVPKTSKTLEALGLFIFGKQESVLESKYSKAPGTDIEVVIGNDYKAYSVD